MDSQNSVVERAIAIVGVGAILPDALNPTAFWQNLVNKRYSIIETPPERWSIADYYDPDPSVPDKTYSKIGGWVRGFEFDWKKYRIPPRVAAAMDAGQQWAVTIAGQALADYGYPERPLDTERTGVILGTAMGGEMHYFTSQRIFFPGYLHLLEESAEFRALPAATRQLIIEQWHQALDRAIPPITEDTMPGELANIYSGRVANVFNLRGPNFITDAACASSCAAVDAAVEMLTSHRVDAVLTGGVDRNMGINSFVKFCKIGALSATGTRPFGEGADGFVMGEGSAMFLLRRLEDAERDGDKIYAVLRGVGASSDGKGKGITAPNPVGQQLAIRRAWENAGLDAATATLVEAHGTSTKVGDVVEVESLATVFKGAPRTVALGSVKSNFGHLKAGAGAAGLLKATLALHYRIIPPTLHAEKPNPDIDFAATPFYPATECEEWKPRNGEPRRAGVSAYGFGGTNFHIVLEEHQPGKLHVRNSKFQIQKPEPLAVDAEMGRRGEAGPRRGTEATHDSQLTTSQLPMTDYQSPLPPRGILALGASSPSELKEKIAAVIARVQGGWTPPIARPDPAEIRAKERLVVDFGDREELLDRLNRAQKGMAFDNPMAWRALQAQGIFRGSGKPGKIAFLFPGQGSQYLNMGRELAARYPIIARTFADGDRVMTPVLGAPLTSFVFLNAKDPDALKKAERRLTDTDVCQPAMLTLDTGLYLLLAQFGFKPDMVMGHSLGEYAALIAAGVMPFDEALEAAAARGHEMAALNVPDKGWMAAVMAPYDVIEQTLKQVNGYVVAANINAHSQSVIGGASQAVEQAIALFQRKGIEARRLPVSHAFHTAIVAPASAPLRKMLDRLHIARPQLPLVGNVNGEFYPDSVEDIKNLLEKQIASPVQWVKGLETLYSAGARTFIEVGPKKALKGLVDDVLGDRADVVSLLTNHPKTGELPSFNQALCGLYAAGYEGNGEETRFVGETGFSGAEKTQGTMVVNASSQSADEGKVTEMGETKVQIGAAELGQVLAQAIQVAAQHVANQAYDRNEPPRGSIVVTGTGLGLPGAEKPVMDPDNALRILRGEQFVDLIPERFKKRILAKRVTRIVKSEDGSGRFETITDADDVIRLAGRPGPFDLTEEYGVPAKLVEALDMTTQLAMAAGLDALREAGIPLVQSYKRATTGKMLPERWMLPEGLRDETGIVFASAFPGNDRLADEFERYYTWQNRLDQYQMLEQMRACTRDAETLMEINRRLGELREAMEREPYEFDRRFLFRVLSMGHSQFAEYIGARGPNTQVNAACASTAQAIGLAEDWIRHGRARRVIVVAADVATSEHLMEWIGAGFLASGAAATDDRVDEAALPFDKRRHGTLMGMGACALVVESEDAVRERGMRGVVELLSSVSNNSAFHGTRLDVDHISSVMDDLISSAERRFGINRYAIAPQTVFMSHETFTPARGGSASAEVFALRKVFGPATDQIIVANTKGFTGHPMGVGVEDVIAVKILEYGIVPPVPNFKEIDPELGALNLSRGGRYPVQFAIHLAAGFGSQIAMTLTHRIPGGLDRVDNKLLYNRWLEDVSGQDHAETEVVKRVLRVKANGAPGRAPAASAWRRGTGPTVRVAASEWRGAAATMPAITQPIAPPVLTPPAPAQAVKSNGSQASVPTPAPVIAPSGNGHKPEAVTNSQSSVARGQDSVASSQPSASSSQQEPAATSAPTATQQPPIIDSIEERVLAIVAAKTGYPREMLALDLDLEADLGIDTVKQAETFAAIREEFTIPRRDNLKLREYSTLAKVIGFVKENTSEPSATGGSPAGIVSSQAEPGQSTEPITAQRLPVTTHQLPITDSVSERVLAIVAAKTGYPREMLDLDLDLEADLGIDTVKQAETFAAIREEFNIPRRDNLKLRDYPTLARVIGFVKESVPELASQTTPTAQTAVPITTLQSPMASGDAIAERVLAIVASKTGYPREMLDLDLDLEADLGIDTVKQAETFAAIREEFSIPRRDNLKLRDYPTLAKVIGFVRESIGEPATVSRQTGGAPGGITTDPSPTASSDDITERVLAIVAAKTGYPREMLDLDLDLEADLGIDTVKQAETFAAIREEFSIPRRENLKLREYSTLAKVIGFVKESVGSSVALASQTKAEAPAPNASGQLPVTSDPLHTLEEANRMPRRVPTPVLRPVLELCKSTGVTLDANGRVIVMPDEGNVAGDLVKQLHERGVSTLILDRNMSGEALEAQVKTWLEAGPIHGVYWLPALDVEPNIEEMTVENWHVLNTIRVKNLYTTMRALYEVIKEKGTFLVSATRLGGLHGYEPEGATAPLGGGVSGFTKAYKRERPDVLVKVVDFGRGNDIARALIDETLADPGAVEIGYRDGTRFAIGLEEQPVGTEQNGLVLDHNSVFVVTGAAGGITSAIVADLAAASGGVFYLLDLVPAPEPTDPHVALFRTDKEALKTRLIEEAKAERERPTPAKIDKQILAIERQEAALRAIESVQAAGGTAYYRAVNLLDGPAVAAVVDEIRERHGRIGVVVHAGGVEISRSLPDKDPKQFDLVYDIKADGFFHLLHAAKGMPIGATVVFSSVAGRFGNNGQTDYSAANDLLCKITSSLRGWRPDTRGIAIDWTAWGGIGMATRGSIPKIMEMAGIDMLPPESGIPTVRRELTAAGDFRGEIVVAGKLGILTQEWDEHGGLDPDKAKQWLADCQPGWLMIGALKSATLYGGLEVETTLDPSDQPFLYDHAMGGTPLLPGVMGIETFAELASVFAPDYCITGVENVSYQKPFKFFRMQPQTLHLYATGRPAENGDLVVTATLKSVTTMPRNEMPPQVREHFTAQVRLAKKPCQEAEPLFPALTEGEIQEWVDHDAIYNLYFHGPAYQVLEKVGVNGSQAVGWFALNLPPEAKPADSITLMAPRLIELCYQTAGLWEIKHKGMLALPMAVRQVRQFHCPEEASGERLTARIEAVNGGAEFNAEVVDERGNVYVQLKGYKTIALG